MKREAGADASIGHLPLVPATLDVDVQGGTRDRASRLAKLLDGETASYAVLSVGDLLYDSFRIDPLAVEGIDFARAADLSDILRLAHFSEGLSELSARAQAGNIAQLQGYVAERVAAHALLASGADGVMVGRGAYGAPWLPGRIAAALATGKDPGPPALTEQGRIAAEHYEAMLSEYGRALGLRNARKHVGWYLESSGRPIVDVKRWRKVLCQEEDASRVLRGLSEFYAETAEMAA